MGQGVTRQENQSRCVQCGKQGTDHEPLNRCGASKTSRYCSKGCQNCAQTSLHGNPGTLATEDS